MSEKAYSLIIVAGWEERFLQGVTHLLDDYPVSNIKLIQAEEYTEHVRKNVDALLQLSKARKIPVDTISFKIEDSAFSWNRLEEQLCLTHSQNVLFDISTAPREIIWFVLHFVKSANCVLECVYSKPASYGSWLSKDPGKPRLVFNHSGMTHLDRPTALLIISGFDLERANQLIQFFEPKKAVIALQTGNQYENHKLNVHNHLHRLEQLCDIEHFEIDTFKEDGGYSVLSQQVNELTENYNVIATSLGPKPSAIALFSLQRQHQQIALCYVPSLNYNTENYSRGFKGYMSVNLLAEHHVA